MIKKFILSMLILLSTTIFATETGAEASAMQSDVMKQQAVGQLGFMQIDGDSYVQLNFGYEINLGLIGVGVQLPLNILVSCGDDDCDDKTWNKIRKADWDEFSDYFKIIRYFRYGHKFDEKNLFYARVGALSNAYIGHGTILNNYLNTLSWDTFKPGVQFDVYTNYGGIETITDDITNPNIIGFRGFIRPLSFVFSSENYLSNFAVGFSFISDINAPKLKEDGELEAAETEFLKIFGFDLEFRVFSNKVITITPYTDFNFIGGFGNGMHFGIDTKINIPLTGAHFRIKPEYRVFSDEYIPTYFDAMYEFTKWSPKYLAIETQKGKHGYYIELGYDQYLLESLIFNIKGIYEDYEGEDNSSLLLYGSVPFLDNYKFSAIYSKAGFDKFEDAFGLENALLLVELSMNISGPLFGTLQYQRTWFYNEEKDELESDYSWNIGFYVAFTF